MKRVLPILMAGVLMLLIVFPAQSACAPDAQDCADCVCAAADDGEESGCPCSCHLFYASRDTLIDRILDKTIDCKTLFQVASYCVKLFTWRVLGVRQYCECGSRHY